MLRMCEVGSAIVPISIQNGLPALGTDEMISRISVALDVISINIPLQF